MLTVAFAAIPYFLVSNPKAKTAAMRTSTRMNQAKIMAVHRNLNRGVTHGDRTYVLKTSNGEGKAIVSRSGQVVRVKIVKGGDHVVSPVDFETRVENKVKRSKPNET
jgi:hypothetical protein